MDEPSAHRSILRGCSMFYRPFLASQKEKWSSSVDGSMLMRRRLALGSRSRPRDLGMIPVQAENLPVGYQRNRVARIGWPQDQ